MPTPASVEELKEKQVINKMDESWENWPLDHIDMEWDLDEELEALLCCESESERHSPCVDNLSCIVPNSIGSEQQPAPPKRPRTSSSPRTFLLSFHSSTVIPAHEQLTPSSSCCTTTTTVTTDASSQKSKGTVGQGGKKTRSDSQSLDHIMAERKRRQELTAQFIQLSATIPGLKKKDKSSILVEAINYVKRLQEQVRELEKRNEQVNKYSHSDDTESNTSSTLLPDLEVRVLLLEKEVLIEIHCEKQNGIHRKLLERLQNLDLRVTATTVLPFGNSTLGITIIAKMGDAYRMTLKDLTTNLKQLLFESRDPF